MQMRSGKYTVGPKVCITTSNHISTSSPPLWPPAHGIHAPCDRIEPAGVTR